MPLETTIEAEQVLTRAWGVITFEQIRENLRTIGAHPAFRPDLSQLVVFKGVKGFLVSFDQFRELAEINPFGAGCRRAFVTQNDLAHGVLETFARLLPPEKGEARVFREQPAAESWLAGADVAG